MSPRKSATVTEAGVQRGAVRKGLGAADRLRDLTSLVVDLPVARPGENGAGASAGRDSSCRPFERRSGSHGEDTCSGDRGLPHGFPLPILPVILPALGRPAGPHNLAVLAGRSFPQTVKGTLDPSPATIQYVRVDHRGLDVLVTRKFLDGSNVVTVLQQMDRRHCEREDITSKKVVHLESPPRQAKRTSPKAVPIPPAKSCTLDYSEVSRKRAEGCRRKQRTPSHGFPLACVSLSRPCP